MDNTKLTEGLIAKATENGAISGNKPSDDYFKSKETVDVRNTPEVTTTEQEDEESDVMTFHIPVVDLDVPVPEVNADNIITLIVVIVSILSLILFGLYIMYEPLPSGIEEQWKLRPLLMTAEFNKRLVDAMLMSGFSRTTVIQWGRYIMDVFFYVIQSMEDPAMEIYNTEFDSVNVRVYQPRGAEGKLPGLMYFHGGGWIWCSLDTHHQFVKRLAQETNSVVISVDFSRAPENPYPIPLRDCLRATKHLMRRADEYDVKREMIGVAGDSTGGTLAAAVANYFAKDWEGYPRISHQVLMYPLLQAFDFKTASKVNNTGFQTPFLTTRAVAKYWLMYYNMSLIDNMYDLITNNHISTELKNSEFARYVSQDLLPTKYRLELKQNHYGSGNETEFSKKYSKVLTDESYAPLMAKNLSAAPPTLIITAEYDPVRDDGIMYAQRLDNAGVKVQIHEVKDGFHGFMTTSLLGFNITEAPMEMIRYFIGNITNPQPAKDYLDESPRIVKTDINIKSQNVTEHSRKTK